MIDEDDFPDTTPKTVDEQKTLILERTKRLMVRATSRTETQQARYKRYFDKRIRSTPDVNVGDEVFIDNPPSLGKPMSERLADEPKSKLSKKASKAYKVLATDDSSVTIDRDGIEDKVSLDRVTKAPPPLDPVTLKPQKTVPETPAPEGPTDKSGVAAQEGEATQAPDLTDRQTQPDSQGAPGQPQPRRSERHPSRVEADAPTTDNPDVPTNETDEREWAIERLLDHAEGDDGGDYLVRWYRCGADQDLWLPAPDIPAHFKTAYHRRKAKSKSPGRRGRRPKKGRQ